MPTIEFKIQWTKSKNSNAILRDTSAEIEIIVDNKLITKNMNTSAKVSNIVLSLHMYLLFDRSKSREV